jgi:hypothetical protein
MPLDLGLGEIRVLVPDDVCVTTEAKVGVGAVNVGDGEQGGIDLDVDDDVAAAPGVKHLHVVADVDIGAVSVGDSFIAWRADDWSSDRFDALQTGTNRLACMGAA